MDILMKGMFGRGKGTDKELTGQMRMLQQINQIEESSENEMERQIVIDFKQYEDIKFDDDLDSDKE